NTRVETQPGSGAAEVNVLIGRLTTRASVRSLVLSSQLLAKSRWAADNEEVKSEPIKFSTSKASHRTWKVDRSMGSQYKRPWWKVVPISLLATAFLLWCIFRDETDVDAALEKQLYENAPGLLLNEEEDKGQK
uniref:Ubiquinol-cytochrome c reductase complex assembly factor 4 n=1 Tax=Amphilophus citrinellus TaxID=61819 RepID=A0A3Q0TBQ0_AMPCI